MRRIWSSGGWLLLAVVLGGCPGAPKAVPKTALTEAERAVIAAFPGGTLSVEAPIRVVLVEPAVEASQVGAPLDRSPFSFTPAIAGTASWATTNEIVFRPTDRLPGGTTFQGRLDLRGLPKGRRALTAFDFAFATLRQALDVTVDGLAAEGDDGKTQVLTGRLVTADVADAAEVEKTLKAGHGGRALTVAWDHDEDHRSHTFRIAGIERAEATTVVRLSWDGGPIGADGKDGRDVTVPGLNTFEVSEVRAVQEGDPHVELRFSDPLRARQKLDGFVRVDGRDDLRYVVKGSVVEVFGTAGWSGAHTVRVEPGVRNALGYRLKTAQSFTVSFEALKPEVRFVGKGTIVPTSAGLKIPVEVVNVRSLLIEATRLPEGTLPQFFQVNRLDGEEQLNRVGQVVWTQTVPLDLTKDKENRWIKVGLDIGPLLEKNPGGMYRLRLSFRRSDVVWPCDPDPRAVPSPRAGSNPGAEASYWDAWESMEEHWGEAYERRHDPCHPGYYHEFHDHDVRVGRNVLVSDLGLLAKTGADEARVVAVDLRSTEPMEGVEVLLLDYQQQEIASGRTDGDGQVRLPLGRKPFLAVARHRGQIGCLRMDDGSALSVAHFDVGGAQPSAGLKGFLYGERGVWRPGDTIHLTFLLFDPERRLPASHPVRLELKSPRGQLVETVTRSEAQDGFYTFELKTDPDAPTGAYTARVTVGGATFERTLRVETIAPNRLKIALDFGTKVLSSDRPAEATLSSTWLHGAVAKGLKADVELALQAAPTRFERYPGYVFDDPAAAFATERLTLFDGKLDGAGRAAVHATVPRNSTAPGMLAAHFTARVFEPGGAFSIDRFSVPFSPYSRYVGLRLPKGDAARGMLLTDSSHVLELALVDAEGKPVADGELDLKLYKIDWRWWWAKGEEDLSVFANTTVHTPLAAGRVTMKDGAGRWTFEIKYPDWGRYLIVASDMRGGHRAGTVVYMDWPGWAGRGQRAGGEGASVLAVTTDKPEYAPGETVTLTLPTPHEGRLLVTLESGSRVVRSDWVDATGKETRFTFPATAEMVPNVYAHVSLLQPHGQTGNDLPIRLYGIAPVRVVNAETRLRPVLKCPDVLSPNATSRIVVREAQGRPMTYTVAVVDEGLLSLTRFATPDPWGHFYAREALGVRTWDVYDHVTGAYGAAFDRMLAVGGDAEGARIGTRRANRFPPLVRFLGPFTLAKGATGTHKVAIPQYVGAVRVMVVAGHDGAFGASEKSAFVRRPLMLLGTLPRVLGPEETVTLPISIFALEPTVKDVAVSVTATGPLAVVGSASQTVAFREVGDQMVSFRLAAGKGTGVGRVVLRAVSGTETAEQSIELDVRSSATRITESLGTTLEAGRTWTPALALPQIPDVDAAILEVSRVPPLDLGRWLTYLVRYPHGCVEQTTSAAFPQLYLARLMELSPEQQATIEGHVKAAIERLRGYQMSDGGFAYWPGHTNGDDWSSSYVGHFLVEAKSAGYRVPAGVLEAWTKFQGRLARRWSGAPGPSETIQSYRLFTLALAGTPELGAMNQLRERGALPVVARWRLAAAYRLAGQPEAARAVAQDGTVTIEPYRELSGTFGSDLRDRAMVLEALSILEMYDKIGPLTRSVSASLCGRDWLSTHETSFALLALARVAGANRDGSLGFAFSWNGGPEEAVTASGAVIQRTFAGPARSLTLRHTGGGTLYPRLVLSGMGPVGTETAASHGLKLEVAYLAPDGTELPVSALAQGTDFKARVKVTNTGARGDLKELALAQRFPPGWEIVSPRLDATPSGNASPLDYQDVRDDRVFSYFDLRAGETKTVEVGLNAAYLGRFYLPALTAEAMYDASIHARAPGSWIDVRAGE